MDGSVEREDFRPLLSVLLARMSWTAVGLFAAAAAGQFLAIAFALSRTGTFAWTGTGIVFALLPGLFVAMFCGRGLWNATGSGLLGEDALPLLRCCGRGPAVWSAILAAQTIGLLSAYAVGLPAAVYLASTVGHWEAVCGGVMAVTGVLLIADGAAVPVRYVAMRRPEFVPLFGIAVAFLVYVGFRYWNGIAGPVAGFVGGSVAVMGPIATGAAAFAICLVVWLAVVIVMRRAFADAPVEGFGYRSRKQTEKVLTERMKFWKRQKTSRRSKRLRTRLPIFEYAFRRLVRSPMVLFAVGCYVAAFAVIGWQYFRYGPNELWFVTASVFSAVAGVSLALLVVGGPMMFLREQADDGVEPLLAMTFGARRTTLAAIVGSVVAAIAGGLPPIGLLAAATYYGGASVVPTLIVFGITSVIMFCLGCYTAWASLSTNATRTGSQMWLLGFVFFPVALLGPVLLGVRLSKRDTFQ